MSDRNALSREIRDLPESLVDEVIDFVRFLKTKRLRSEEALLTQSILAKDWLNPEEDQAWASL